MKMNQPTRITIVFFIKTKSCPEGGVDDAQNDDEEEHESQGEETAKQNTQSEK